MQSKTRIVCILVALLVQSCNESQPEVTSTLIRDVAIYDGSGAAKKTGALRIDGDRIVAINFQGELEALRGETVIDANGLALAPGFIDSHSHHDSELSKYRNMPGVLSQGVTTIVRGADGFSGLENEFEFLPLADFNATFTDSPAAVNVASFAPHNSMRYAVLGDDFRRPADDAQVSAMSLLLDADLAAGALGLATGLEYDPGIYSSTDELIALARVTSASGGRYASHIRDEDDGFIAALGEVIAIAAAADIAAHISHIKIADREFWGKGESVIQMLSAARSNGLKISADIYPYQRWASDFSPLFPDRVLTSVAAAEYAFAHTGAPDDIVISAYPLDPGFVGKSIADIAAITERSEISTLLELAQDADEYLRQYQRSGAGIIVKGMHEDDIAALMQWEFTNICSDGGHGGGHPRGYGAFPRVLGRYVRDLGVVSLPVAIHKMTGLTADTLGIAERGRLAVGNFADLVLFDPILIADKATMQDSTAASVGIEKVWVNGVLAFDQGMTTGAYGGQIVKRAGLSATSP